MRTGVSSRTVTAFLAATFPEAGAPAEKSGAGSGLGVDFVSLSPVAAVTGEERTLFYPSSISSAVFSFQLAKRELVIVTPNDIIGLDAY